MRRIVVAGGGIAGVEAALVLARGLPDDHVTLVARSDVLHVAPDLLYIPAGVDARRVSIPLRELLSGERFDVRLGELESIDVHAGTAQLDVGEIDFDVIIAAPGAEPAPRTGLHVQSVEQAELVRDELDHVFERASRDGQRAAIMVRAEADDAWSPPAYELALLLAARRQLLGLEQVVSITLVTGELQPFEWFDPGIADLVVEALDAWGVELALGVDAARMDDLAGDLAIDFPRLEARSIPGLPGRADGGFYDVDADGRVAGNAFVVGDAAGHGYRAAFAAAWQARRVLAALGGAIESLGKRAAGVPLTSVEHHVDLGHRTLRIRMPLSAQLRDPWLGRDAVAVLDDRPPDRLAGLLLGDLLHDRGGSSAADAHRALFRRSARPRPSAGPAERASSRTR